MCRAWHASCAVPTFIPWLLQGLNGAIKTPKGYNESANGMADYPSTARLANQARSLIRVPWVGMSDVSVDITQVMEGYSIVKPSRQRDH